MAWDALLLTAERTCTMLCRTTWSWTTFSGKNPLKYALARARADVKGQLPSVCCNWVHSSWCALNTSETKFEYPETFTMRNMLHNQDFIFSLEELVSNNFTTDSNESMLLNKTNMEQTVNQTSPYSFLFNMNQIEGFILVQTISWTILYEARTEWISK